MDILIRNRATRMEILTFNVMDWTATHTYNLVDRLQTFINDPEDGYTHMDNLLRQVNIILSNFTDQPNIPIPHIIDRKDTFIHDPVEVVDIPTYSLINYMELQVHKLFVF